MWQLEKGISSCHCESDSSLFPFAMEELCLVVMVAWICALSVLPRILISITSLRYSRAGSDRFHRGRAGSTARRYCAVTARWCRWRGSTPRSAPPAGSLAARWADTARRGPRECSYRTREDPPAPAALCLRCWSRSCGQRRALVMSRTWCQGSSAG